MRASYERVGLVRPGDDRSGPVPAASRRAKSCCSRDRRRAGASQGLLCRPTRSLPPGHWLCTGWPRAPAQTPARIPARLWLADGRPCLWSLAVGFFPLGWSVAPRCRPATQSSPDQSQTGTVQLRVSPHPSVWDDRVCVHLLAHTMLAACATAQRTAIAVGLP